MNIDYPNQSQTDELRALWQEAFGDDDAFLEHFFTYGFAPDRCRCVTVDGKLAAALYWFDCSFQGKPLAYLYGVATFKAHRGKGFCKALAENTHNHLKYLGYAGEILVPAGEKLFQMYEKMGYEKRMLLPDCGFKKGRWLGLCWMEKRLNVVESPSDFPTAWRSIVENAEILDGYFI